MLIYRGMKWIDASEFDLEKTLHCGQVFHWERFDGGFAGAIGEKPAIVQQQGARLRFGGADRRTIRRYFALDHPLMDICATFPRDATMKAAADFCRGLRIIRQPKWECLGTFIFSSMKQVAHIRQISLALRRRFGAKREIAGTCVYDFPAAEKLARASREQLERCALGYRAANLRATANLVAEGKAPLEAWGKLPDEELRRELCQLPGVGAKVANCVMLFGYERIAAFPIDVWIERVLRERYFRRRQKVTTQMLSEFSARYFGAHGGYAQQYLFHHARTLGRGVVRGGQAR